MTTQEHLDLLTAAIGGDAQALAALAAHRTATQAAKAAANMEKRIVARAAQKLGDPIARANEARRLAEAEIAAEVEAEIVARP